MKRDIMESKRARQVVISKEDAVFWMDENGVWHNEHGKFEHPRIIKYFNASIQKDAKGYFVAQSTDLVEEKVYFKFQKTAVFAVNVRQGPGPALLVGLNTGNTVELDPKNLMVEGDSLYLKTDEHLVKFTSNALLKLSGYLKENEDGQLVFSFNGTDWPVDSGC